MSATSEGPRLGPNNDHSPFKWACLGVAVVALTAYGWMLNDVRLEVKGLRPKVEKLTDTAEDVAQKLDRQLPRILAETEQAGKTINTQLPPILAHSEVAVDSLAELSDRLGQSRDLMGALNAASQDKSLLAYGTSVVNFVGEQNATVGVKKSGPDQPLKQAVPAKQWARAAQKDARFLSLAGRTKADVLHGLARTGAVAPFYIRAREQAPRLLADWLREMHPESMGVP